MSQKNSVTGVDRPLPELDTIPAEWIKEYLLESDHQSWEGFSEQETNVLLTMLGDLRLYAAVRGEGL